MAVAAMEAAATIVAAGVSGWVGVAMGVSLAGMGLVAVAKAAAREVEREAKMNTAAAEAMEAVGRAVADLEAAGMEAGGVDAEGMRTTVVVTEETGKAARGERVGRVGRARAAERAVGRETAMGAVGAVAMGAVAMGAAGSEGVAVAVAVAATQDCEPEAIAKVKL